MDLVICFLVLSALPQLVQPVVPSLVFRSVVEITSGHSKVFSGESVRLRCSVPDNYNFTWHYLWFRGPAQLPQNGESLVLWNANTKESGKYYCQGVRNSIVGKIHTLKSVPVEIIVDGGWAILQVPPHPGLVGESLMMTCHVRANPPIREVILYKDGVEVLTQKGLGGDLHLTNLTLEDGGLYSCRASWDTFRHTISVISTATPLQVLEVLTEPIMEIADDSSIKPSNMIKLVCHVQYNARDPAPSIYFYFYKNNKYLAMATSLNYVLTPQSPGIFTCMATVPRMGLSKWSDPKTFGRVTGTQTVKSRSLLDSDPWASAPPDMTLFPPFEPSEVQSSIYPPPLIASQPALTTPSPSFQSANNQNVTSETEDASGDFPDADSE